MRDTNAQPEQTPSRERGFTLIEILVVMIIVAILMAVAVMSFRGAKTTAADKETRSVAAAYDTAMTRFLADHANQLPTAADFKSQGGIEYGPINLLGKPYIGSVPDAVLDGRVSVSTSCGGPPAGGGRGHVSICGTTAPNFEVRVYTRASGDPWPGTPTCVRGTTATATSC